METATGRPTEIDDTKSAKRPVPQTAVFNMCSLWLWGETRTPWSTQAHNTKRVHQKKKEEKSTSTLHNVALLIFCPHKVFLFFRQGGMTTWKGKCNKEDIKGCEYTQYKMQDLNCFNHSWNKWEPVAPHFQWPESLSRRDGCHVSYTDRRKDFAQINFALWDRFFIQRAYRLHKFQWV